MSLGRDQHNTRMTITCPHAQNHTGGLLVRLPTQPISVSRMRERDRHVLRGQAATIQKAFTQGMKATVGMLLRSPFSLTKRPRKVAIPRHPARPNPRPEVAGCGSG